VGLWGRNKDKINYEYWELASRDDIDLIRTVTPPFLHAEMALVVLEAGKHLVCEKPLALNLAEAAHMLQASRLRSHQFALVDHELRFSPVFQRMRSLIQSGYIGDPKVPVSNTKLVRDSIPPECGIGNQVEEKVEGYWVQLGAIS
jgi:predicted dehydrogenase